jgi:hypothetical protein
VAPVGRAYDMGSGGGRSGLPTRAGTWRFLDAAEPDGAVGAHPWTLEKVRDEQWDALADYPWKVPLPRSSSQVVDRARLGRGRARHPFDAPVEANMFKKLTLFAGFGAGYVLGAKAGTERYNQIQQKFNEFAGKPAVQNATSTVKDTATGVAGTAKQTINEKVETLSDKGGKSESTPDVVVDLGPSTTVPPPVSSPSSTLGAPTTSATPVVTPKPMTGAAASDTASDSGRL